MQAFLQDISKDAKHLDQGNLAKDVLHISNGLGDTETKAVGNTSTSSQATDAKATKDNEEKTEKK